MVFSMGHLVEYEFKVLEYKSVDVFKMISFNKQEFGWLCVKKVKKQPDNPTFWKGAPGISKNWMLFDFFKTMVEFLFLLSHPYYSGED